MRPFQGALVALSLDRRRREGEGRERGACCCPPRGDRVEMMDGSLVVLLVLGSMFLLVLFSFLLFFACSRRWQWRWRFFSPRVHNLSAAPPSRLPAAKNDDDLETPLFSENSVRGQGQGNSLARKFHSDESSFQTSWNVSPTRRQGVVSKQKIVSTDITVNQDVNSVVLDIAPDASEDFLVGQTLKYPGTTARLAKDSKHARREQINYDLECGTDNGKHQVSSFKDTVFKRSCLNLEVISGPSSGLNCSRESTDMSRLQVTLGRVPPSDLLLKDNEVSGKHAMISWNTNRSKWELVDMGSLNGTLLNSQVIHQPDSEYRSWSNPVELANGDIITLGSSSKLLVQIMPFSEYPIPFGVGMASDPMATRKGGKRLAMEDMCYCQWPLPGVEQFGLFGIFDGHGGAGAAKAACKMLPLMITNMLSNPERRKTVLSICDASEILRDAFSQTEAAMDHEYEGCTATVLLIWCDHSNEFFAQCANVGDSACVMNISGNPINMTEDHRVTSLSEQTRLRESGRPLKDGEARLCGLNLARMLGDKFLKEQDPRFSSEPFISQVVHIRRAKAEFALLASDGLWDVISTKRVVQLIFQTKERDVAQENSAKWIANYVLNEARTLRTKDNTSIIFLDFSSRKMDYCKQ